MFEYKFESIIGDKKIKCRAFTLREYKSLMEAKINGNLADKIKNILSQCTDATGLNKQESELLLIKLWAESLGEINKTLTWVCQCGEEIPVNINMSYAQISNDDDLLYDFENFKIKFKYPELFEDSDIASMICSCIDYIIVGDEKIKIDELNSNEINDLYQAITIDDIKKISAMLLKPTVYLAIPISCHCGNKHIHKIEGLKEFMELL